MNKYYTFSLVWLFNVLSILIIQLVGAVFQIALPELKTVVGYVVMIVVQLSSIAIVFIVSKKRKINYFSRIQAPTLKNSLLCIGIAIATFVGMFLISNYVFDFLKHLGVKSATLETDNGFVVFTIVSTVLFAPIGEEFIFRLVGCSSFDDKHAYLSVILTSLAFVFMHMSPMQTFFQIFLGVVLAIVYIKTKNVVYTVMMHGVSNLVSIVVSLSFEHFGVVIPYYNVLVIILAFLICALAALLIVFLISKLDKHKHGINDIDNGIIENSKNQKALGTVAYVTGFAVCFAVWITAFF